jgi:hypothetical protein
MKNIIFSALFAFAMMTVTTGCTSGADGATHAKSGTLAPSVPCGSGK